MAGVKRPVVETITIVMVVLVRKRMLQKSVNEMCVLYGYSFRLANCHFSCFASEGDHYDVCRLLIRPSYVFVLISMMHSSRL